MLRVLLASAAVVTATFVVFACSSDPAKPADNADAGGGAGDDDDSGKSSSRDRDAADTFDAGCVGRPILDCDSLLERAKSANCTGFDDTAQKSFTVDCNDLNCATPTKCSDQLTALGNCIAAATPECNADNTFNNDTPDECTDQESALTKCKTGN